MQSEIIVETVFGTSIPIEIPGVTIEKALNTEQTISVDRYIYKKESDSGETYTHKIEYFLVGDGSSVHLYKVYSIWKSGENVSEPTNIETQVYYGTDFLSQHFNWEWKKVDSLPDNFDQDDDMTDIGCSSLNV